LSLTSDEAMAFPIFGYMYQRPFLKTNKLGI